MGVFCMPFYLIKRLALQEYLHKNNIFYNMLYRMFFQKIDEIVGILFKCFIESQKKHFSATGIGGYL